HVYSDTAVTDTSNWTKVSGIYKARGGEKHIILGSFASRRKEYVKIKYNKKSPFKRVARYYIDDVCVTKVNSKKECACNVIEKQEVRDSTEQKNRFDEVITLPDLTFKTNEW